MLSIVILLGIFFFMAAKKASLYVWMITYTFMMLLAMKYVAPGFIIDGILGFIFIFMILCAINPLRQKLFSAPLLKWMKKKMPAMSSTEREALEAGTISWEGDILSGTPDFNRLLNEPLATLTEEEQAFIEGPVNELCRLIDDWDITHNRTDMPPDMWQFIKEKGFLGLIIPKKYQGLAFSATAQVIILSKIYGRSITVATTISVPNSLGPAELLLKYGTEQQKDFYLPRLARGEEIPCFALTGPQAGSDAASIPDKGIVCRQDVNGESVLGMRLTWNKRYITLCPVATVIGLAFRLYDPENLLGQGENLGISCALIPADTPGVIKGRRHFPLNTGFLNGPTQGKDVFVPIDCLIGGVQRAGAGWRMLMDCLSAGRAISLPSSALGGVQMVALASGAYARVRKQFHQPIGKFEGIEEPLARIAGNTYLIDAALMMTAAAIDQGAKPAVAGAIIKYQTTERARQVALDAMDIHGGKGICLGPNNYLGRGFQNAPISITVEGANILTRNLIIFGQGAIRCHPYLFNELEAVRQHDLISFDKLICQHIRFFLSNTIRSFFFALIDSRWIKSPESKLSIYYQHLYRYSTQLAFLADFCMMMLGAKLKFKEKISARLGDMLSTLYLISAVLKRIHSENEVAEDLPLATWCCQQLLYEYELALHGLIENFPITWARLILKVILQPWGRRRLKPSDKLGQKLAQLLIEPNPARTKLTRFVFKEMLDNCPIGYLEEGFQRIVAVESLEKKVNQAAKQGQLGTLTLMEQIEEARQLGILNEEEVAQLKQAEQFRQKIITVDDFSHEELARVES